MTRRFTEWGEEIVGEHREVAVSASEQGMASEAVWQLQRVSERDYDRREFGREFTLVRFNASMTQSFNAGHFNLDTARALRDMLTAALEEQP